MTPAQLCEQFAQTYGRQAERLVRAPGRVNLIGEHIDYNGGPVLPIASDMHFLIAAARRDDSTIRLRSLQEDHPFEGTLPIAQTVQPAWANYPLGVIHEMRKRLNTIPGFDALITSTIPPASGLSSSAAFEVAAGCLVLALCNQSLPPLELAQFCQRAENHFVGVQCGLMDQAASACGRENHALLLDCAQPACRWIPMPDKNQLSIVVAHSGVHRGLTASAYNQRRSECEQALAAINRRFGTTYANLCQVPLELIDKQSACLDERLYKRSRHVITEAQRVHKTASILAQGREGSTENLERAGELFDQSHASLRDDYAVSCPELDALTDCCRRFEGVYGSRLTGAGFGGCTVTLVKPEFAEPLMAHLKQVYYNPKTIEPILFITQAANGAEILSCP